MDLKRLAKKINQNFGEPFLPKGFVEARIHERENGEQELHLRIGDRDADFDSDGYCTGAGTSVGPCGQYKIKKT